MVIFPTIDNIPVADLLPLPLKIILLKLLALIFPAPLPLKSIVEEVWVNVPLLLQFPPTVCVKAPAVKLFVMFTLPVIANIPVAVLAPAPLKLILLKLLAPILAEAEPLKSIVELPAVNVPDFVQFPPTV